MIENKFASPALRSLFEREFLYQFTDDAAMDRLFCGQEEVVFYVGYDPTAKSLHVGHLLWIRLVKKLQEAGLKPIILTGGATAKIGDPTWKDAQRVMLDHSIIVENAAAIDKKLAELISFGDSGNLASSLNNDDWLSHIKYMEFLRDFGPMFSVNKMLSMDSVSTRLERKQHLSFLEFNYMLLQAYDFLHLFENHKCQLQVGGADQWANMVFGVDLIRKKTGKQAFGMSIPLLTNSVGQKMGKTETGAIWLDSAYTSPFDFWQYWRNVDDRDVTKFLKLFTDIPLDEIEQYEQMTGTSAINEIKITLADAITGFVHPSVDIDSIKRAAQCGHNLEGRPDVTGIETFYVQKFTKIDKALAIADLAPSVTAGKRLIDGNAVKINNRLVENYDVTIEADCFISVGRKKLVALKVF
ncbi:MAG: tyrosine--tRNA ligase [Holosporales bacterium]|nr:tyrosine--tRNA ligase [Holosporales bacterium]